jgi:hypothetical protein
MKGSFRPAPSKTVNGEFDGEFDETDKSRAESQLVLKVLSMN